MKQLIALLVGALPLFAPAQTRQIADVGFGAGVTSYYGDLASNGRMIDFKNPGWFFSTHLRCNMGNRLALRGNLLAGKLAGDDNSYATPAWRRVRGISFSGPVVELSILGEVYPFGIFNKSTGADDAPPQRRRIAPYFMAGIGAASQNPMVDWNAGNDVSEPEASLTRADQAVDIRAINLVVPFGAGVRIALNNQLTLGLEAGLRPTFSDYLDGVSLRGNPNEDDWYFAGGITLSYTIVENKPKAVAATAPQQTDIRKDNPAAGDRDKDGVPDAKDACPDVPGTAAAQGCPETGRDAGMDVAGGAKPDPAPDTDGDGVPDKDDACPTVAGEPAKKGCPPVLIPPPNVPFRSVYFATSKDHWYKVHTVQLDEIAGILRVNPGIQVRIEGHADNTGNEISNYYLSERRARNCYEYLLSRGINGRRMRFIGFGSDRPVERSETKKECQLNRRAEIYFSN